MAWHFGTTPASSIPASNTLCVELFVGAAIAAGYTVPFWSDGTTQHTSGTPTAGFLAHTKAYVVLKTKDGLNSFALQVQSVTDNTNWYIKWSQIGFSGGTATHMPAAADEVDLAGSTGPDSGPTFALWLGTSGSMTFACAVSSTAPYPFYFAQWDAGVPYGCAMFDGMAYETAPSSDANPTAIFWPASSAAWLAQDMTAANMAGAWQGTPEEIESVIAEAIGAEICAPSGTGYGQDPATNKDMLVPVWISANTGGTRDGWKGAWADFYLETTSFAGGYPESYRLVPTTLSLNTTLDTIVIGSFAVPWDGSSPGGDNGPYDAEIFFPLGFCPPVPPPPPPPLPVVFVPPQQPGLALNLQLQIGTTGNPNPYGVDINCLNDLDPYFSLVGGIQCLAQDLYHLITCPTGSLFWAPSLCFDSRGLLSQSVTPNELRIIQNSLTATLQSDERVQSASVIVQFNTTNNSLTVTSTVQPLNPQGNAQPFQMIASISSIGSNLLSIGTT